LGEGWAAQIQSKNVKNSKPQLASAGLGFRWNGLQDHLIYIYIYIYIYIKARWEEIYISWSV